MYKRQGLALCIFLLVPVSVVAQTDNYDLGQRTGHFIGLNVVADLFQASACRNAIPGDNSRYLNRNHFMEAVSFVRKRYKDNVEVQRFIGDDNRLSQMRDELIRQSMPVITKSVGENPTPKICGLINAEIDNLILTAKARLP